MNYYANAKAVMEDERVKEVLREHVPEVHMVEGLEELTDIELTMVMIATVGDGVVLSYEGRATNPSFYEDPIDVLRHAGIIQPNDFTHVYVPTAGTPTDVAHVELRRPDLELSLDIKPYVERSVPLEV